MARRFQTTDVVSFANDSRFDTSGWNTWLVWYRDRDNSIDDLNLIARGNHGAAGAVSMVLGSPGTRIVYCLIDYGGYAGILSGTIVDQDNDWHCAVMRFYNGAGQTNDLFVDGVQSATQASGSFTWGGNPFIAGFNTGSTSTGKDVEIGDVAWWNVRLSDNELIALVRGIRPERLYPESLLVAPTLWGLHSPEIDVSLYSDTGTVTGTSVANGPPVKLFSRLQSVMEGIILPPVVGTLGQFDPELRAARWF